MERATTTIIQTGAEKVWITHGREDALQYWCKQRVLKQSHSLYNIGMKQASYTKAFSNLLNDLILTSSRNRKISLLIEYFSSTPDPDRGYALAALTGSQTLKMQKLRFFKELVKEEQDEYLFDLSYDYVGDLAETVSLLWDKNDGDLPSLSLV